MPWHTIYESEDIRHELTRYVLGIWDWIKNKDPLTKELAANHAIDWGDACRIRYGACHGDNYAGRASRMDVGCDCLEAWFSTYFDDVVVSAAP